MSLLSTGSVISSFERVNPFYVLHVLCLFLRFSPMV